MISMSFQEQWSILLIHYLRVSILQYPWKSLCARLSPYIDNDENNKLYNIEELCSILFTFNHIMKRMVTQIKPWYSQNEAWVINYDIYMFILSNFKDYSRALISSNIPMLFKPYHNRVRSTYFLEMLGFPKQSSANFCRNACFFKVEFEARRIPKLMSRELRIDKSSIA